MKKFIICYFFFLFFLLSFFASGVIDSQDGFQYLAVARNIYYKGEPTAPKYEYPIKNIHMSTYVGKDGKTYSMTGLGYSLAMVPAVALTDVIYKIFKVSPPVHFPLESDWLVLMLASFTNCVFAAGLGVILFIYFLRLRLNKKQALFMSFISLFTTNLFAYSKHSVAHMMFITFLMTSFLLLKIYIKNKKNLMLILSGICYGIVMIAYNQTFVLPIIPFIIYYFLLTKFSLNKEKIIKTAMDGLLFISGTLPLFMVYYWFEKLRGMGLQSPSKLISYGISDIFNMSPAIILEGLYGQILSPGRSIFLYSPLLLVIFAFWHKIKRSIKPELITFICLSSIYIGFYSLQKSVGKPDQGIAGLWHGELSWGPRYISPLIPFGMLIVGHIFGQLKNKAKLFVFFPLVFFGFYVEILGVLMPYQIKLHDLQYNFVANGTEYTRMVYANLLPRYSPIIMMSKKLIKLIKEFPKTLDHGLYNVCFYDGVDFAFNIGGLDRWRVIEGKGYLSFDNLKNNPVKKIGFNLVNHPLNNNASSSAYINFLLNNKQILKEDLILNFNERKFIDIPIPQNLLKNKNNDYIISVDFDNNDEVVKNHTQFVAMMSMSINGKEVNKESINVPYVSGFGPKMTGIVYKNWGGTNKDPWKGWHIHTQIFERVPDFWWAKAMYYWDFPKKLFLVLFLINLGGIFYFAYQIYGYFQIRQPKSKKSQSY